MSMPLPDRHWTVDDLALLPDDGSRYEIVDGELLVTPAPSWRHQRIVRALFKRLLAYLEQHPIGEVLPSPADVVFAPDFSVQPDLFVVPPVGERQRPPETFAEAGRLLLAVEVLSLGTMRTDRYRKRPRYQQERVEEIWIVDGDAQVVERWRPDDSMPDVLRQELSWHPDPAHPPLAIDLAAVFREAGEGRAAPPQEGE